MDDDGGMGTSRREEIMNGLTCELQQICDDFKARKKPVKGAWLPAKHGAIATDPSMATSRNAFR